MPIFGGGFERCLALGLCAVLIWRAPDEAARGGGEGAAVLAAAPDSASRSGGTSVELCEAESA